MRISIILAHPDVQSFNHAIAQTAAEKLKRNGHNVVLHDLCAEGFDPLLPACEFPQQASLPDEIERHCREISAADGIVIVHPNWWGQPPAILKGWVDRVIRPGVAYKFLDGDSGEGVPVGLLRAKAAVVFNTSNTSPRARVGCVRRSPGNAVEKLHIRPVRGDDFPPRNVRHRSYKQPGATQRVARPSAGNRRSVFH